MTPDSPTRGINNDEVIARLPPEALSKLDSDGSNNYEFNSAVFSFALSWINAGGDEAGYVETVASSHVGETYPRSDLERRLATTFADAEEKHTGYRQSTLAGKAFVIERLGKCLTAIDTDDDLPPQVKPTARAIVSRALSIGAFSLNVSTRQLAEDTGLQAATISRHLPSIKRSMLIKRVDSGSFGQSRTFHINLNYGSEEESTNVKNSYILSTCKYVMCNIFLHLELWSKHGLGSTAQRLYGDLTVFPRLASDIHNTSELSRPTATKHLATLVEHNLVVETTTGKRRRYAVNLLPDVDSILESTGARELQQQQKQLHNKQRQQFEQVRNTVLDTYRKAGVFPADPWPPAGHPSVPFKLTREGEAYLEQHRPNWRATDVPLEFRVYPPKHDPYDGEITLSLQRLFYAGTDADLWDRISQAKLVEKFPAMAFNPLEEILNKAEQRQTDEPRVTPPDPFGNTPTTDENH